MYAEIIINSNARALNKIFDYIVPKNMEKEIKVGTRVLVPFGKGKKLEDGFVINFKEESEFANKEISKIEIQKSLTEDNIVLAKLMARKYFCNISDCIKLMLPPGTGKKDLSSRVKEKTGNFVYLKKDKDEIEHLIQEGKIKSEKHIRILKFLEINDGIYLTDLSLLTDISKGVIKTLEKNGYVEIIEQQIERNPFINKNIEKDYPRTFTEEQKKCFEGINFCIQNNEFSRNLIYGITGSGKTEIYLQLIKEVLDKNRTAIVLVPEISLTPQMVDRFLARFGEIVAVLHSKLSIGERYDQWQRIENGEAKIVIGARSGIFAPVRNLGIIIIDEEHDVSYKADSTPRYNAKDVAKYIAEKNNCPLVLGSATPELSTMYMAKNGDIALFTLTKRANDSSLPKIEIVDLRNELAIGNRSMLSLKLQEEIKRNLKSKNQTILFLNRRGYSTFVMCRECGYVAKCKNCNISLTYHKNTNKLKCHYCGYEISLITECPECNSSKVKYLGTGTQKLEDEIKNIFPEASTIRMDIDTVGKKNSYEEILGKFRDENVDILIGTQMVVKGHHFPKVTLVGVVLADGILNIEDYRSVERTFQTLVQVSGRSGRESDGRVLIQTYNPDHYAIVDSQQQDYDLFYNQEVSLRKMLNYPPFCDIIMIRFIGDNLNQVQKMSNIVYSKINSVQDSNIKVYKPVPSPIDKIKNKYRWRIILKCRLTSRILDIINYAINDEQLKRSKNISIIVDVNPNTMN